MTVELAKTEPPWEGTVVKTNILVEGKKENLPLVAVQQAFSQLVASNTKIAYTDGSKSNTNTGAAFKIDETLVAIKLHPACSIYSAELIAILKLLEYIQLLTHGNSTKQNITIATDSMSAISALKNNKMDNPLLNKIKYIYNKLTLENHKICFT